MNLDIHICRFFNFRESDLVPQKYYARKTVGDANQSKQMRRFDSGSLLQNCAVKLSRHGAGAADHGTAMGFDEGEGISVRGIFLQETDPHGTAVMLFIPEHAFVFQIRGDHFAAIHDRGIGCSAVNIDFVANVDIVVLMPLDDAAAFAEAGVNIIDFRI